MGIYFALANLSLLHTLSLERNPADATMFLKTTYAIGTEYHTHKIYQGGSITS